HLAERERLVVPVARHVRIGVPADQQLGVAGRCRSHDGQRTADHSKSHMTSSAFGRVPPTDSYSRIAAEFEALVSTKPLSIPRARATAASSWKSCVATPRRRYSGATSIS